MSNAPFIPAAYLAFLASDRLSSPTREVVEGRIAGPAAADAGLLPSQIETLRAMIARVIPQEGEPIDLTGYLLAQLADGKGDGWRFDILPEDAQAYREGLDRLAEMHFSQRNPAEQDAALTALAAEKGSAAACWFEEVRGAAVQAYVAHPATLARLGYSGFGVGGAESPHQGFVTFGPNEREPWEPLPTSPLCEG